MKKHNRKGESIQMKKAISILLTVLILMGIVCTAFAAGVPALDDDAVVTNNKAVRFYKEITVYNPDNATVKEPTASYTYTVTAGSADKTIKDSNSKQTGTKTGTGINSIKMSSETSPTAVTASYVTLTYAPGSSSTMTASSTGSKNTKWVDIDFSGVVFPSAGVYRYKITESGYTYNSNGVVAGTTGHERFIDVYVKDAENHSTASDQPEDWEIYGYAMFTADENIDATVDPKETKKTTGFVAHYDGDPSSDSNKKTADSYYTFNLTVQKTVVNDSYIKNTHHQFPFTVTLSNETVTKEVLPILEVSNNATQAALAIGSEGIIIGNAVWNPTIADGASVTYTGIPAGTTITIKEKNDVSGTTYEVASSGADTNLTAANVAYNTESGTATVSIGATAGQAVSNNKTVVFSNNLQTISPTGYVARFAPYALMLIGGIALLIIAKKHKKHTDEEDN